MLMVDTHDDDIEYAKSVLHLDPCKRPTPKEALMSEYFTKQPVASSCAEIALYYEVVETRSDSSTSGPSKKSKVKPISSVDEFLNQLVI